MTTTIEQFESDISEIASCLVQAYGLTYEASRPTTDDLSLQRWMDYRLRHISSRPRTVEKSVRFPVQNLPEEVVKALAKLESMFKNAEDVNAYLSKTTISNDVSASKPQRRTDGLWADWRIHHLHLTNEPLAPNERFSKRSNWLLFVMVYEDVVAFIDIRDHNEEDLWTQVDLFRTFIESWPEQAEPYRVARTLVDSRPTSPSEYKSLRSAGINTTVECNGAHYFGPGQGVTTAVTSIAGTMSCDKVTRNAQQIARWLDHPENPIRVELQGRGIPEPRFSLGLNDHGLNIASPCLPERVWSLPEFEQSGNRSAFGVLKDLLAPSWAIPTLMAYLRSKS